MTNLRVTVDRQGVDAWERLGQQVRSLPRAVKSELRKDALQIAKPLADAVRAAQRGSSEKHANRMAATTRATVSQGLPTVRSGGLPYSVGAEFGGGLKVKSYTSTSPLGTRYVIVGRHTTMQYRRHRGTEGYEIYPTVREDSQAVLRGFEDVVDRVIDEYLGRV